MINLIILIFFLIYIFFDNKNENFSNKIKLIKKKYIHYDKTNTKVDLISEYKYTFYIIYFVNCIINKNYNNWLINQINLIKHFNGTIYIIATILKKDEEKFRKNTLQMFPGVNIECYYENEFEYRGILKVWQLAHIYNKKTDIFLYFHSKGITHYSNYNYNKNDNYNIIFKDKNLIEEIFTIFSKIDKVGYCASKEGLMWYNFWYARGSYINQIEKPIKTIRRHYYEDWLMRIVNEDDKYPIIEKNKSFYKNSLNACYSFYTNKINIANIGSYYDSETNKFY